MPKLKRLLVSACFETAQRRRRCSRNQERVICQGDKCLVIKENMSKSNYCMECAALILRKSREELALLGKEGESRMITTSSLVCASSMKTGSLSKISKEVNDAEEG